MNPDRLIRSALVLRLISVNHNFLVNMPLTQLSRSKVFGGILFRYSHQSSVTRCEMKFHFFKPNESERKSAVLWWLSGLTCTDENFVHKAGAFRAAAKHGIALVVPDTSPRGLGLQGESTSWDFGVGAGFYVDATVPPFDNGFQMYSYITKELAELVAAELPIDPLRQSIFGHSMGGHGALVIALRNPGRYRSVSAFAPIANPTNTPLGHKAFVGYLGSVEAGAQYDATLLAKDYSGPALHILIDQGNEDQFYRNGQLMPEALHAACLQRNIPITLRYHEGYDHSYNFIASFIDDHIEHHARLLQ
jgi:S-formylglutathione hydrolase